MSGTAPVTGTATRPGGSRPGVPGPVAAVLRAPFTRRAWAEFGYAMAGLPLGVAGFAFTVATLAAGAALTLTVIGILVGLPLLAVSSLGARGLGAVNRGLARRLLGVRVAAPPPFRPQPGLIVWVRSALTDAAGWRARAYLVLLGRDAGPLVGTAPNDLSDAPSHAAANVLRQYLSAGMRA